MTNNGDTMNEQTTQQAGSQKAEALQKYTQAKQSGRVWDDWYTLNTHRFDLIPPGEPVTQEAIAEVLERAMEYCPTDAREDRPLFVRACPLNPRPGVLESSAAYDKDEFNLIFHRIVNKMLSKEDSDTPMYDHGYVDPHGSIIVQPFIQAHASCVAAPGSYIIMGPDNDGVTASKPGFKVAIPHTDSDTGHLNNLNELGINPANIELEFVSERTSGQSLSHDVHNSEEVRHNHFIVQLRGSDFHAPLAAAPAGVTINGLIPQGTVEVKHVHLVANSGDDELARMEAALHAGMPDGTVVAHPTGSHLSHHAGQCRKYGVPYIAADVVAGSTWVEAAAGWVIDDPSIEPQPYNPYEYHAEFARGLSVGVFRYARQHGWLSNHFHQFTGGPLMDPANTAFLGGTYVGWVLNSIMAVALGEMRHASGRKNNTTPLTFSTIQGVYHGKWVKYDTLGSDRQNYYYTIEQNPVSLGTIEKMLTFLDRNYATGWETGVGYGGTKYAEACANGVRLARAVRAFVQGGFTEEDMLEVVAAANVAEHAVHNNGYFFNKFMPQTALDWGTDPTKIRLYPQQFFRIYYAAAEAYSHYDNPFGGCEDHEALLDYVLNESATSLRNAPLFARKDLPEALAQVGELIGHHNPFTSSFLHPSGLYNNNNEDFISCGHAKCAFCSSHIKAQAEAERVSAGLFIGPAPGVPQDLDMTFPAHETVAPSDGDYAHTYANVIKLLKRIRDGEEEVSCPELYIAMGYYLTQHTKVYDTWNQAQKHLAHIITQGEFDWEEVKARYESYVSDMEASQ